MAIWGMIKRMRQKQLDASFSGKHFPVAVSRLVDLDLRQLNNPLFRCKWLTRSALILDHGAEEDNWGAGPELLENIKDGANYLQMGTSHVLQSMVNVSNVVGVSPEDQTSPCAICLNNISERARTSPCGHGFDFICIVNWLERNPTCPLCKSRVSTVEYGSVSQQDAKVYRIQHSPPLPAANTAPSQSQRSEQDHRHPAGRQIQSRQNSGRHASHFDVAHEGALEYRKHIYRHQLYSLHVGSNRLSRFQELTPTRFAQDNELVSRARKWIRRELQVFEFLAHPDQAGTSSGHATRQEKNAEFLLEWIVAMLKSVNIKGSSGQAEDMLQEFLGRDNARLFLHELRAWLRSPYSELREWDCHVQYDETARLLQHAVPTAERRGKDRRRDRGMDHYEPYPSSRPVRGGAG